MFNHIIYYYCVFHIILWFIFGLSETYKFTVLFKTISTDGPDPPPAQISNPSADGSDPSVGGSTDGSDPSADGSDRPMGVTYIIMSTIIKKLNTGVCTQRSISLSYIIQLHEMT